MLNPHRKKREEANKEALVKIAWKEATDGSGAVQGIQGLKKRPGKKKHRIGARAHMPLPGHHRIRAIYPLTFRLSHSHLSHRLPLIISSKQKPINK